MCTQENTSSVRFSSMGLYDADVIKKLGKEAYNYILDRVRCGVISGQHMKDISGQLHPHILGNHLRRVESGRVSDEAEFRQILSDWFNQELYDLDQKTALLRLISILKDCSVGLPAEGKKLKQILDGGIETRERIQTRERAVKAASTLRLNYDVSFVKHLDRSVAIMKSTFLQESVSECRERCAQEIEELRKDQTERVQLLLQQQEKKEQELKAENERALSLLLQKNEAEEALMLAKHKGEERSARRSYELKTGRNASGRPSEPSHPQVPECPVCNFR